MRSYLCYKNQKLGASIASFSIPRGISCLGMTRWCTKYCYGKSGNLIYSKVRMGHAWRYEESQQEHFVTTMINEIKSRGIKVVRVHVVGDFYSVEYINKWIQIAQACPSTTFYSYTRCWRLSNLLPKLQELNDLDNWQMYASIDDSILDEHTPAGWSVSLAAESNVYGYKECTSKCHSCNWCYATGKNVYFETRKLGRKATRK